MPIRAEAKRTLKRPLLKEVIRERRLASRRVLSLSY
jgi:hypothetical protein